ncbi:MAG: hypothetical protein ACXVFT_16825 [Solirubrobacteraceae bacterium]
MTVCIVTTSLGSQWFYPVIDPWRTAGPGPYRYGYPFAWDGVVITVTHNSALSRCQMRVELSSSLAETKEIQAFNFFNDTWSDQIDSVPGGAVTAMTIAKRKPGDGCGVGTDTVVLARATAFGPRAMYTYPIVQLPDGTLMKNATGLGLRVVFGGTDFPADPGYLRTRVRSRTLPTNPAVPFFQLPAFPADFTVLREWNRPEVFVVFGGAKFLFPDPQTLMALGFTWNDVRDIPRGGTSKLRTVPIDGTLITEQHDQRIFLVDNAQLRLVKSPAVMDARCLPRRHVRTVPDTALSTLPHGPDLDLP